MKRAVFWMLVVVCVAQAWADSLQAETQAWRQRREAALRRPDGWLTLAGLFWLQAGDNSFGSAEDNACLFPPDAPAHIGTFRLQDGKVMVDIRDEIEASTHHIILDPKAKEGETKVSVGTFSWYVIEREGRVGIRLKNSKSPVLASFHGLEYYPVAARWRVVADFAPYDPPRHRKVPSALGTELTVTVLGMMTFEGQHLEAYGEPNDKEWEIIFGDRTNGHGTYPAGRYLDVPPAVNGKVTLDFNRAYNPPCAFTPYATCSYPPLENRLSIAVEAGERFRRHP